MDIEVYRTKSNNSNIKPFLVDVPVKTNIWIRPECQKKQFEVIRKARPSILFLQSDGGRNEEEWEKIRKNRELFKEIDWDCTVHCLFANENYGLYGMAYRSWNYIWKRVDRCIFLEDDHIPSVSFFRFCKEMLDKYENDLRIAAICGTNVLGDYKMASADYVFSRNLAIWGVAYWKRTYDSYNLDYKNDEYTTNAICQYGKRFKHFCKLVRDYGNNKKADGHIPGSEFYLNLNMIAQNQMFIFPKRNMISCMGVMPGSAHSPNSIKMLPKGVSQIYNMKTYELNQSIKYAKYVFPDIEFEKKQERILALHHPLVAKYRRIVRIIKRIYYGDGKKMLMKKINNIGNKMEEK